MCMDNLSKWKLFLYFIDRHVYPDAGTLSPCLACARWNSDFNITRPEVHGHGNNLTVTAMDVIHALDGTRISTSPDRKSTGTAITWQWRLRGGTSRREVLFSHILPEDLKGKLCGKHNITNYSLKTRDKKKGRRRKKIQEIKKQFGIFPFASSYRFSWYKVQMVGWVRASTRCIQWRRTKLVPS